MKRFIAILIALTVLMSLTVSAESSALLYFGNYAYDPSGSDEYEEPEDGYSMIDYGDYVVTIEYFELASNGYDQAYFDGFDTNDGYADSWEIGSLLLSIKYDTSDEDCLYAWYEEEPTDNSFAVNGVLFNGELTDELGNGAMAGMAFVTDGTLLLLEVISFGSHDLADMQALRSEHFNFLTYNGAGIIGNVTANDSTSDSSDALITIGNLVFGSDETASVDETAPVEEYPVEEAATDDIAGNMLSLINNTISSSDSSDDSTETEAVEEVPETSESNSILPGIGGNLNGVSDADEDTTTNISGIIGANISAGISTPAVDPAEIIEFGSYTYDISGCEEYELDEGDLKVDYGSRVVYAEYGTFAQYGNSFAEMCEITGIENDCTMMAQLFFENSDYADSEGGLYENCEAYPISDYISAGTNPEGIIFIGNLTADYGGGPIVGCILISEEDILMLECVSFSGVDSVEDMITFFIDVMGKMTFDEKPVLN